MQTETKHTAYEGWQDRCEDMRAMYALARAMDLDDLEPGQAARLNDLGMSDEEAADLSDVAYSLADSYVYGAHVLYTRDDDAHEYRVSRVELLLAGGGPTHVLTWDERGSGWSDYFDSWAEPQRVQLSPGEHVDVENFLRAFITSEMD